MNGDDDKPEKWRLDRHIPLALIVTIIMAVLTQTVAGVWWASAINQRLYDVEQRQAILQPQAAERLVKLETTLEFISKGVEEIKVYLRNPHQPARAP